MATYEATPSFYCHSCKCEFPVFKNFEYDEEGERIIKETPYIRDVRHTETVLEWVLDWQDTRCPHCRTPMEGTQPLAEF